MKKYKPGKGGLDVDEIFETWISGYAKGNVARLMSIYDEKCVYSEPCLPDFNFDELAGWFKYDFARPDPRPTWEYEIESVDLDVELAVVVSRWTGFAEFGSKLRVPVRQLRSIDFLRGGPEGWKIFRTLNDPVECPCPKK